MPQMMKKQNQSPLLDQNLADMSLKIIMRCTKLVNMLGFDRSIIRTFNFNIK